MSVMLHVCCVILRWRFDLGIVDREKFCWWDTNKNDEGIIFFVKGKGMFGVCDTGRGVMTSGQHNDFLNLLLPKRLHFVIQVCSEHGEADL
jgi:hypothetical protein